jgi:glycosyltransferase involved in cell wall biosynthesis
VSRTSSSQSGRAADCGGTKQRGLSLAVVCTHPVQYQVGLWRALPRHGVEPTVFYGSRHLLEASSDPHFGSFAWDVPLLDGYRHEFLETREFPRVMGRLRQRWGPGDRWPKGLTTLLRQRRFDAVLVHGYVSGGALAGILAGRRTSTPIVMRGDTHARGRRVGWRGRAWRLVLRALLSRVSTFLAIGSWNREYWLGLGVPPERIRTSLLAVDNDYFRGQVKAQPGRALELRQAWGAASSDVVFLFSGKLIPTKDPETLVRAFARLPKEPLCHLVVVGAGPLERSLQQIQRELGCERVVWQGFVNQSEIAHHYSAADVLVLPSLYDAWGLAVNEALACGVPCIVSDRVGAGPDMIEPRGAGEVFTAGDAGSLEHAMLAALNREVLGRWRDAAVAAGSLATFDRNAADLAESISELAFSSPTDAGPRRYSSGIETRSLEGR